MRIISKNAMGGYNKLLPQKVNAKNKYYKILNKLQKNIEYSENSSYNCKKIRFGHIASMH